MWYVVCCCCRCCCSLCELFYIVGCSVALCARSVCACHYRMKIESISLIYCSCSCVHSTQCVLFFSYSFLSRCIRYFFSLRLFFLLFFDLFSFCVFFLLHIFSLNASFFYSLTPRIDVGSERRKIARNMKNAFNIPKNWMTESIRQNEIFSFSFSVSLGIISNFLE